MVTQAQKLLILGGKPRLNILDNFDRADGDLGNGWSYTAGLWTIATEKAVATPGLGLEKFDNPGFEGVYVGGLAPNWTIFGTPTLTEEGVIIHGGAAAQKVVSDAANEGVYGLDVEAIPVGNLIQVSSYIYATTAYIRITRHTTDVESRPFSTLPAGYNSWQLVHGTLRIEAAIGTQGIELNIPGAVGSTFYFDDASMKRLTMADLYCLRQGKANFQAKATTWNSGYEYVGIAFRMSSLTNPQTGYVAYHNGTQIVVEKLTAGLWAKVGSNAAATYVAGAILEVRANGATVQTYYNGALIRTDTLADYASQTILGMVSTYPSNSFGYFQAIDSG